MGQKISRRPDTLGAALPRLNEAVHDSFAYTKGATDNSTPLEQIWKHRKGVCQDFAHVILSVLRTSGLPARYVCGYIEAAPPRRTESGSRAGRRGGDPCLGGGALPGMSWFALDPTNRKQTDERYVTVSFGRDARDAAPLRGTFKGSGGQKMTAKVLMERLSE